MNEEQKERLILNISNFYALFQKEILNLLPDNNKSELSPLLFKAIHEIHLNKNVTPSFLSKALSITVPNTSRCIQQLCELGYIVKAKDDDDKRVTHIRLTEKGLDLVRYSLKRMDEMTLTKLSVLNADELQSLSEAFSVLVKLFGKIEQLNAAK